MEGVSKSAICGHFVSSASEIDGCEGTLREQPRRWPPSGVLLVELREQLAPQSAVELRALAGCGSATGFNVSPPRGLPTTETASRFPGRP